MLAQLRHDSVGARRGRAVCGAFRARLHNLDDLRLGRARVRMDDARKSGAHSLGIGLGAQNVAEFLRQRYVKAGKQLSGAPRGSKPAQPLELCEGKNKFGLVISIWIIALGRIERYYGSILCCRGGGRRVNTRTSLIAESVCA